MEKYLLIQKAWQQFLISGEIVENTIRPIIANSWKRSAEYGIDPYSFYETASVKDNHQLLQIAKPYVDFINYIINCSDFITIITNEKGVVIDVNGLQSIVSEAEKNQIKPGALISEDVAGTNAVGLAIVEKKPIEVYGPEHYSERYHNWTCAAAPIKDRSGNIIGIYSMSGHYSKMQKHTFGLVASVAKAIEEALQLKKEQEKTEMFKDYLDSLINSNTDGVIAVKLNGKIMRANRAALSILENKYSNIDGRTIDEIIEPTKPFLEVLNTGKKCVDQDVFIAIGNKKVYFLLTATKIHTSDLSNRGYIFTLRERKRVHNLLHRIAGASASFTFNDIVGSSQPIRDCIILAKAVANADSKVLIEGESGTGKELFAQAIHNQSSRQEGPFVAVNCSAIPNELIESELFGYEQGAFTGAKQYGKPGKFEIAEGGTIFLDEVSSMSLNMQSKVLRVIQENKVVRVGGNNIIPLDVRIISATNRSLFSLVGEGSFREDLYYRLSVVTIKIPSLISRGKEDILQLVSNLAAKIGSKMGIKDVNFDQESLDLIIQHRWPGNVRELENVIERALVLSNSNKITKIHLPDHIKEQKNNGVFFPCNTIPDTVDFNFIKELKDSSIQEALYKANGNISKAAISLGISRTTIYNKLKKGIITISYSRNK